MDITYFDHEVPNVRKAPNTSFSAIHATERLKFRHHRIVVGRVVGGDRKYLTVTISTWNQNETGR